MPVRKGYVAEIVLSREYWQIWGKSFYPWVTIEKKVYWNLVFDFWIIFILFIMLLIL